MNTYIFLNFEIQKKIAEKIRQITLKRYRALSIES